MKLKTTAVLSVALLLTLFATVSMGTQDQPNASAFFPETSHEFTPVLDGAKVVHEFVLQNKGTAMLKVEKVKTG
ncbi:MAG: DUF1573 domain-containing protein [bacterium]|nr:DUF1573 domain-containing protein [bacterium]